MTDPDDRLGLLHRMSGYVLVKRQSRPETVRGTLVEGQKGPLAMSEPGGAAGNAKKMALAWRGVARKAEQSSLEAQSKEERP
ncbi:hypothetical protein THAOC_15279, partial [Thalassiosira oceanica]